MSKNRINFFWSGDGFDYLNYLTIKSHIKVGHKVIIWLHGGTPESEYWSRVCKLDITVNDADSIINITDFMSEGGNFRTASSLWRFRFLYEYGGWYSDCDALALKHWPVNIDWMLCSGNRTHISTGVILCPSNELMFLSMIDRIEHVWGNVKVFDEVFQEYKIDMTTTHESNTFYPYTWKEWDNLLQDKKIPDSYSVHLYNTMFERSEKLDTLEKWVKTNPNTMLGRIEKWINS